MDQFLCCHNIATRRLVYNGGYIQNKNKQLNCSKFSYESRLYIVTKATRNLDHIGWIPNEQRQFKAWNRHYKPVCDLVKIGV